MAQVIQEIQVKALEKFIAKEIKKHLRKFAKVTEMERSNFDEFLQDWVWSLDNSSEINRLYQTYVQIKGNIHLLKVDF